MTMKQKLEELKNYAINEHKKISKKYITSDLKINDEYDLEMKKLDNEILKKIKDIKEKYKNTEK